MIVAVSVFVGGIGSACSAKTTVETIDIPCSVSFEKAPWVTLGKPDPKVQYIITAKGIKMQGISELITQTLNDIDNLPPCISENEDAMKVIDSTDIEAKCIPQYGMDDYTDIWPPSSKGLTCKKGEGVVVKMFEPSDVNPDKYHFIGLLTKIVDDEDLKEKIVIKNEVNNTSVGTIGNNVGNDKVGYKNNIVTVSSKGGKNGDCIVQ